MLEGFLDRFEMIFNLTVSLFVYENVIATKGDVFSFFIKKSCWILLLTRFVFFFQPQKHNNSADGPLCASPQLYR